jgi:hypothetical protein
MQGAQEPLKGLTLCLNIYKSYLILLPTINLDMRILRYLLTLANPPTFIVDTNPKKKPEG